MELEEFKINRHNNGVVLEKNNQTFTISQSIDNDIWFSTSQDEMEMDLSLCSDNYTESETYMAFEYLMKTIVGRYVLSGDNKKKYSCLPKDFIDLENNSITWHSDGSMDSTLKLEYDDGRNIKITISRCNNTNNRHRSVRIRTIGSDYEYYYQEFLAFFRNIVSLEQSLNKTAENAQQDNFAKTKKLS